MAGSDPGLANHSLPEQCRPPIRSPDEKIRCAGVSAVPEPRNAYFWGGFRKPPAHPADCHAPSKFAAVVGRTQMHLPLLPAKQVARFAVDFDLPDVPPQI